MKKTLVSNNRKANWVFCTVTAILCVLLCLLPDTRLNVTASIPREQAHIDAVDNSELYPVGIVYSGVQTCKVTVLTGQHQGKQASANNYLNSALDKDKLFVPGDTAYVMLQDHDGELTITLIDHYRATTEAGLLAVLAIALIVFGGLIGCGALISLAASFIILWKVLIPLLLIGFDPILSSFLTVLFLTALIDLLVAGCTRRCAVALAGSIAGTLITCVLAVILTDLLKLDGGDLPYVVPLLAQSSMKLDTRALYIGMIFIANSGALMDLSMDISVACEEIRRHKPDISSKELLKSGLIVGRGVLGTMTTTLMLAYSGNYLSMLMYFAGQGTPLMDIINLKYISSQLLNTLVGSFGLVATAPLSALAAVKFYRPKATE
ncbi:MAG: YibE/F family protein [Eubacteriales bacterium]|nr:YibE/F family protein [Eubacteriales bacterium]